MIISCWYNYKTVTKWQDNLQKIRSFYILKKGWDGYNASPVSKKVIYRALELVESLFFFLPQNISPTGSGSIQFEYKGENMSYLEIGIEEDHL